MKRRRLALGLLVAGLLGEAHAQHLDVPETLGRTEGGEALGRSLDWLLTSQNADGSWACGALDGLLELGFSIESFYAWQVAANALACLALLHAPETPALRTALERGICWLETTRPPQRGSDWDIDYVWGGLFGFAAATEIASDARFQRGEWPARLGKLAQPFLTILEKNQIPEGGWGYYDDPVYSERPKWATSFSTATVLPGLKRGGELGWVRDPKILERATHYVNQCALPTGAYSYDLRVIPWLGGDSINEIKGSLSRIQVCNWALYSVGEKKITLDRLRKGLEDFFEHHRFLDVAFMDPIPHEAYYFNSGYFYLFGHYYAAKVIELLPEAEREGWHARLRPHLVKVLRQDGCTSDFLTSAYMKVAGTSFAALALELGLPRPPESVEPVPVPQSIPTPAKR
jgi:hypothetical protein